MNQFKDVVGTPEEQAERAAARDEMNRVYAANLTATGAENAQLSVTVSGQRINLDLAGLNS